MERPRGRKVKTAPRLWVTRNPAACDDNTMNQESVSFGIVIINARQRSCGKVMLSVLSVCHSVGGGGYHVTITHDALDFNVQGPSPAKCQHWWGRGGS